MNKILILLMGAPGAGKTTWATKQNLPIINIDKIRKQLAGQWISNPSDSLRKKALQLGLESVKDYFTKVNAVIWDGTNLKKDRMKLIKSLKGIVDIYIGVFFKTSKKECISRNKSRSGQIDEEIIIDRSNKIDKEPPNLQEGFNLIIYI